MSKIKTTSQVPSAKEFYDAHYSDDAVVILRDFAKLHVKAVLSNIADSIPPLNEQATHKITKVEVLNCYPETNIK